MNNRGVRAAIILLIIIVIVIIIVLLARSVYTTPTSDFGTWSDFTTTICLNNGQGCAVPGSNFLYRSCNPNPRTGFGCIDTSGNQTFHTEYQSQTCTPICYSSVWSDILDTPCTVYDDINGTIVAGSQVCRNPDQFTYFRTLRVCTVLDGTGINACIRVDGTVANVGDEETVLIPCSTIPDCFQGTWQPCGTIFESRECGGAAIDCGRVIPSTTSAKCIQNIAGVPTEVAPSNCYPPDDPGPCPSSCFNFPCIAYPAGYANISAFLSDGSQDVFVEIQNLALDFIEADYTPAQATAAANNQDVFSLAPGYVATQFANTGATVRFRIVPSQDEAANGGFYLLATLPGNGQVGTVRWSVINVRLEVVPLVLPSNIGETLDDVVPQPDLFAFTGVGPYKLNLYTPPVPVITPLPGFCGVPDCLTLIACNCPCGVCAGICGTC